MKKGKLTVRDLCVAGIFAALTAVCAQIAIPLPFTPAPISLGIVGVYTAAILLPPRRAIVSQICYLLLGAVGLPVFGGFRGGISALFGPTGGYLLVYPIIAAIVSFALNGARALQGDSTQRRIFIKGALSICAAHLVLYLGGTVWLSAITGNTFIAGLSLAVFPFIPFDIVKIVFCVAAIIPLRRRLMQTGLLNEPARAPKEEGLESES